MSQRPFHCGAQFADWQNRNCDRCHKRWNPEEPNAEILCDLEQALHEAACGDGGVSDEVAKRIGYTQGPPFYLTWDCPERVTRVPPMPSWLSEPERKP
jgi:hypothetical protein